MVLARGGAIQSQPPAAPQFGSVVRPFVATHCAACHNAKMKAGALDLEVVGLEHPAVWEKVYDKLRAGEMPPAGRPAPRRAEVDAVMRWIEAAFQPGLGIDPGRVTARRLNRFEYNNTVRDLVGVDLRPADDFPADDSGYGFDHIGDVLSLSPVLMEKYLAAAEKIAAAAVVVDAAVRPTVERYKAEQLKQVGSIRVRHRFLADADYDIRAGLGGIRPDGAPVVRMELTIDGAIYRQWDVDPRRNMPRNFDVRLRVTRGEHELALAFTNDTFKREGNPIPERDRYLAIDFLELRGPFNAGTLALSESHERLFVCGHPNGKHQPECARTILTRLARRAYRRPPSAAEVDALVRMVDLAAREGESFEKGIAVALQAVLVSPHFLFRIERDPQPNDPRAVHPLGDHELATRLSYFLWSSMPDDQLQRLADSGELGKAGVLQAEVRRMLLDPKARALVENFAGQWLQIRNLDTVKPDPERFPGFDEELRAAMRTETEMFFEAVVREDRSILDFIDGGFTYLNERLARHYGVRGVTGGEFRRVPLRTAQRGGVLTQASILTVSSYANRTSPVLRGKWLLENFLNAPPPPPPPDVPNLKEEAIGSSSSLRRQLEQHRTNAVCASCHSRMDVLGFGLENYDAIGAWRTRDGKFPVDASGVLPGGKKFRTPAELKAILKADREAFSRCVTEKMLTYALGRGLERYDRPVIDAIVRRLAQKEYRFVALVAEIVAARPFQQRRGDRGGT